MKKSSKPILSTPNGAVPSLTRGADEFKPIDEENGIELGEIGLNEANDSSQ